MVRVKSILCIATVFAFNVLNAQVKIGLSAGINTANAKDEINEESITHHYLVRPNFGADAAYYFDEHWGLQTGIYYLGKGWRERYSLSFDTIVVKLNYLEMPLKLSYRLKETADKNVWANAGLYFAYGLNAKRIFHNDPPRNDDPFERKLYKRFDLGYTVESILTIKNNYGLKVGFSHGLLSLLTPDDKLKNFHFNVSLYAFIK